MTKAFFSDFRGFCHRIDDVTRWSSIECQGAPQPIEIGFVRSYCQSSIVKLINGDGKVKKSGDVTEEIDAGIAQMTRQVLFGWTGGRFVTAVVVVVVAQRQGADVQEDGATFARRHTRDVRNMRAVFIIRCF